MDSRTLGRSGLKVSAFSLGTMEWGGKVSRDDAAAQLALALDNGVSVVDTADCYTGGTSEEIVGALIKSHRPRVLLASKFSVPMDEDDPNARGTSRRHVIQACEASLKRLKTDCIDLYYIHRPHPAIPIEETLYALDDLIRAGKIRAAGSSSFASWQMVEAQWCSDVRNLLRLTAEQTPYHLLDRRIEREVVPAARSHGIGLVVWSPLAGGLLTGKYLDAKASDLRLSASDTSWGAKHFSDAANEAVTALNAIAQDAGHSLLQMALAWTLSRPGVSSIVLGARTPDQLAGQLGALATTLDQDTLDRIDAVVPFGGVTVPYYLDDAFADFTPNRVGW